MLILRGLQGPVYITVKRWLPGEVGPSEPVAESVDDEFGRTEKHRSALEARRIRGRAAYRGKKR